MGSELLVCGCRWVVLHYGGVRWEEQGLKEVFVWDHFVSSVLPSNCLSECYRCCCFGQKVSRLT